MFNSVALMATHRPLKHVTIRSSRNSSNQLSSLGPPRFNLVNGRELLRVVIVSRASSRCGLGTRQMLRLGVEQATVTSYGPKPRRSRGQEHCAECRVRRR